MNTNTKKLWLRRGEAREILECTEDDFRKLTDALVLEGFELTPNAKSKKRQRKYFKRVDVEALRAKWTTLTKTGSETPHPGPLPRAERECPLDHAPAGRKTRT